MHPRHAVLFFGSSDEAVVELLRVRAKALFEQAAARSEAGGEAAAALPPPAEGAESPRRSRFGFLGDSRWQGIAAIVAIVAMVVSVLVAMKYTGGDEPSARELVTRETEPENVIEQIAQRDIWVKPPETFESAAEIVRGGDPRSGHAQVFDGGEIWVVTARDLVDRALTYQGNRVFLVGQVTRVRDIEDLFGLDTEYQLAPIDGAIAFVAGGFAGPGEGDVVYALGELAAVGESRAAPGSRVRSAAYFIADPFTGVTSYEPGA